MGVLLHLVQRGGAWAGWGPVQYPHRCTKCNSPPINGQCTNFILFDVPLESKGSTASWPDGPARSKFNQAVYGGCDDRGRTNIRVSTATMPANRIAIGARSATLPVNRRTTTTLPRGLTSSVATAAWVADDVRGVGCGVDTRRRGWIESVPFDGRWSDECYSVSTLCHHFMSTYGWSYHVDLQSPS